MNKTIFALAVMIVLAAAGASAAVYVTYNFYDIHTSQPLDNVDVLGYPCNDVSCSSLMLSRPLQGAGNSGSSSTMTLTFPTNLVTPYGYAVYYFRPGYAPQEYAANWYGKLYTHYSIPFNKISGCRAGIIHADLQPDSSGQFWHIEAEISSAFTDVNPKVNYIPSGYEDYYSSLVFIESVVYDEQGNPVISRNSVRNILMDTSADAAFSLGSFDPGNYTAVITTTVIDDQCSSYSDDSRTLHFEVPAQPGNGTGNDTGNGSGNNTLDVMLFADPESGEEPLYVEFACAVFDGDSPYIFTFYDQGIEFFSTARNQSIAFAQRTFDEGLYNITCAVQDSRGSTGSDSVLIDASESITPPPVCVNHLEISSVMMDGTAVQEGGLYDVSGDSISNGVVAFDYAFSNTGSSYIFGRNYTTIMTLGGFTAASDTSVMPDVPANSTVDETLEFAINPDLPQGIYNLTLVAYGHDENACIHADTFQFFAEINGSSDDNGDGNGNESGSAPQVTLLFPEDSSSYQTNHLTFIYGVVDDSSPFLECSLYTNISGQFEPYSTQWTPNGHLGFFSYPSIPEGTYIWNVECSDGFRSSFAPENFTVTVNSGNYTDIPASVSITAVPETGHAPLDVQFYSSAAGNAPIIYSWDFGDGAVSYSANPSHTYTAIGTYTATLTITDADGDTASDSVVITVTSPGDGDNGDNGDDNGDGDGDNGDGSSPDDNGADACSLYIGRILIYSGISGQYGDEFVMPGRELFVNVYFENIGDFDLKDIKFRALVPDLGISNSVNFDLIKQDRTTRTLMIDIPEDAGPGDYDIQISARNDCVSRTKYRLFTII